MKNISVVLTFMVFALCTSCVSLELRDWSKGKTISLNVGAGSGETKAAVTSVTRTIAEKDGFTITESVSVWEGLQFEPETKGSIVTTGNMNSMGKTFSVDAYLGEEIASAGEAEASDKSNYHFISGKSITFNGSDWVWDGDVPEWRNDIPTTFWSYYPVSVPSRLILLPAGNTPGGNAQKSISMVYTLPAPGTSSPFADAEAQQDLLFAYNLEKRGFDEYGIMNSVTSSTPDHPSTKDYVDIRFLHALAAVKFDITGVAGDVTVENVSIANVASGGSCWINAPLSIDSFDWTPDGTLKSYSQDFTPSTDFEISGGRNTQKKSGGKVFFMIPQTLGSTAALTVRFRFADSSTVTLSAPISGDEWLAGRYYTYALKKSNGELDLEVLNEGGVLMTGAVDAHFGNAILRFSKAKPTSYSIESVKPDGTISASAADAGWLSFAAPASSTSFASYPGISNTVDIAGLIAELQSDGPKTHFLESGDYYYTQAFIDEYRYAGQPISYYVGKADRSFKLTISNAKGSASGTISQKAMQSPYNLGTAANPFGVEIVEDNTVTAGTAPTSWCLSRNRDEDGNGVIEGAEIKWRAPSLQEYWNIWYGTHSIDAEAWLGLESSKAPALYLSSDGFAYNGQMSASIASPSGTGTVRCVRDLGTGTVGSAMSSVAVLNGNVTIGEASKIYVLSTSNISSESLRSKITGREISGSINPGAGTDTEDNKLYSSIQVGTKYLTWPVSGQTITFDRFEYNLAVNKARAQSIDDFYVSCDNAKTVIEGTVKMVNPDPRLVYSSSFTALQGASSPIANSEWSYLDERGVLHFHVEYSGWSAQNSGSGWQLKAAIKNADGTISSIADNICTLYFAITKKDMSGGWGTSYSANPPKITGGIMIGDAPISLGSESFRLVVVDGGPWSVQNVTMPKYSELFEGAGIDDNKHYLTEYACRNYYYEDTRFKNGVEVKSDLGQWRAPNQRELSMILEHSTELPIYKSIPTGHNIEVGGHSTPEYLWFPDYDWANPGSGAGDKISSLGIKCSGNPYYNDNGLIITNGNAPFRVRCVRDI